MSETISMEYLVVRVVAFEDEGSWWAETPDYPGLTVVAATREELTGRIKPAVAFHLKESGITGPVVGRRVGCGCMWTRKGEDDE